MNRVRSRFRHAAEATRSEFSALAEDFKSLSRRKNGKCAFRHSRTDDINLLVRIDEDLGRNLYFFHEYEPDDSTFILRSLRSNDICVDVGANVGFYTISLATKLTQGAVHAFEPVPLSFHLLALNVLSNNLLNVCLNNYAIGDSDKEIDFVIAEDGGFSSQFDTGRKPIVNKLRIRMTTLDSYCLERNLPRVDFLKVDVEGGERGVISGAHRLLSDKDRKPRLIMLELFDPMLSKFGSSIDELVRAMKSYEYAPFICLGSQLTPFTQEHYNIYYNVFFSVTKV
jgi:FkbM family methyltransferase